MKKFLLLLSFFLGLALVIKIVPFSLKQPATITVTGEAKKDELPQIARFSASVTAANADKQTVVNEVNSAMEKIIKSVKDFGIDEKDIQTQQVSVYQTKEERLSAKDIWQAGNSINITLRNITQASALADLLQGNGAANVFGPNYSLDDTTLPQADKIALKDFGKVSAAVKGKDYNQVVTQADLEVGSFIISHIKKTYPDHNVIDEEAGGIYTDFFGKAIDYTDPLTKTKDNFTVCAATPILHQQLQKIIHEFS